MTWCQLLSCSAPPAFGKGLRLSFPHLQNTGLGETLQLQMKAGPCTVPEPKLERLSFACGKLLAQFYAITEPFRLFAYPNTEVVRRGHEHRETRWPEK